METQKATALPPTSALLTLQHFRCAPAGLPSKILEKEDWATAHLIRVFAWHAPQHHTNGVLWHTCKVNIWEVEEGRFKVILDYKVILRSVYSKAKQKPPGKAVPNKRL